MRPKNGVIYYGVRARADEYAAEMPRYHKLIEMAEADLHALVQDPARRLAEFPRPTLPPPPEGKSKPDAVLGVIKPAAEQQKEMFVAEAFALNLFASDEQFPELRNPVQIAFDARGRLWVVTMPSWPHTVPGSLPEDKILVLEDTDRDGKADKCTVFAEGLDAIDGIAFHEDGVVVSAQPRLLLMRDTNRDGRADSVRELLRGIDVTDTHHGGMIQTDPLGQIWFCDGVFHRSQFETPFGPVRGFDATTYRLDPRTGRVQSHWQSITPNPWKMTFDRQGSPFQMYGDGIVLDGLQLTWTPVGAYHPFGHGKVLGYGKGSGAASISSPNFPDAFQDGMASAALLGRYCVSLSKLSAKDGPYSASERLDLVRSENPAFRPVDLAFGMDGALYISDFTSRIIGHAQHPMRDPLWNHERGRIWRVTHTAKPVVTEWPAIDGAPVAELLELLRHPQNLVRDHARIELRKRGPEMLTALKAWVAEISPSAPERAQCVLEALWLLESKGQTMPPLLQSALNAADPLLRVAALQLVREQYSRLPEPTAWLEKALQDPHPRVRMAVVNAVALLRPQHGEVQHVLHGYKDENPAVKRMLEDLNLGTRSLKGASIPVLELAPETRLGFWQSSRPDAEVFDASSTKTLLGGANGTWRTVVHADSPASAMLSVKAGHVDIALNGIQKLSANSMWSSQQQLQFDLVQGPNQIEITFRNVKGSPPPVFLSNPIGERLEGVRAPGDPATFAELANAWDRTHSTDPGTVRIQSVPNQLQFSPKQLRVPAGKPVRLLFDNPDPMLHNLVIVKPGAAEEVGTLADKMVRHTNAAANSYVPKSSKVLFSSELVEPGAHAELNFTAPAQPGIYPILCTFPGHWRVMRAELVVE